MLQLLRSFFTATANSETPAVAPHLPLPLKVSAAGVADFDVATHLTQSDSVPHLDWNAAQDWVNSVVVEAEQAAAWSALERAWLVHLCAALGEGYQLRGQGDALLLSSLPGHVADATLAFVNKTTQRILRLLDGVANVPEFGHDILIVFDDEDTYYRYVSHFYAEDGEFAGSGGMYINHGCGHFVTVKADLRAIEPVVAHELTHSCLSHLPIPAWLNEGIAVNTEKRLCPSGAEHTNPQQMHARHRKFWGKEEIQQFWSGKSFLRADEGNELSYDLARIIVAQYSDDWASFRSFVCAAEMDDGGASSASQYLGVELGEVVAALLEKEFNMQWHPNPMMWSGSPERGAFSPAMSMEHVARCA